MPGERFPRRAATADPRARDIRGFPHDSLADGFATEEDQIVVTAGVPFNVKGTTNILRVAPCDERLISRVDPG